MSRALKKLDERLEGTLSELQLAPLREEETVLLSKSKQGGDLLLCSRENLLNGIVLTAIQKVPESLEGSPRVLVVTARPEKAFEMYKLALDLLKRTEVDPEHAHDTGNQIEQRNDIFEGAEMIFGNLRRVYDLYIQNGINMNLLQLVILDDLDEMLRHGNAGQLNRLLESFPKCQRMAITTQLTPKVESILPDFLVNPEERDFLNR